MWKYSIHINSLFEGLLAKVALVRNWILIAALTILPIINALTVSQLSKIDAIGRPTANPLLSGGLPVWVVVLVATVIAPLLETLLFQILLINGARRFLKFNVIAAVSVSAIAFSLLHGPSSFAKINAFIMGAMFGSIYVAKSIKGEYPFFVATHGPRVCRGSRQ